MVDGNDNLSDKQLKYSYWLLLHRQGLRRLRIILLVVLDVLLVFWVTFSLIKYAHNYSQYEELASANPNYINWGDYHALNQPEDLVVGTVRVVKSGSSKADIMVFITNPNSAWGVPDLTYQFILPNGQLTAATTTWLLPASKKYLFALDQPITSTDVSLQILEQGWQRVTNQASLSEIAISDIEFTPAAQLSGAGATGGQVNWTAENRSAVSFWDVGWQVILFSGQTEVGFNYFQINSLDSLASRELSINFFESLPTISSVKVIPDVNLYDSTTIKK